MKHEYGASSLGRVWRPRPLIDVRARASILALFLVGACTRPASQMGGISKEQVREEQLRQQQYVIQSDWMLEQKARSAALPLQHAALTLCDGKVGLRAGFSVANVSMYDREWYDGARLAGLSDTLSVVGVTVGSGADRVGVRAGDVLWSVAGRALPTGSQGAREYAARLGERFPAVPQGRERFKFAYPDLPVQLRRRGELISLSVPMDTVCAFDVVVVKSDDLNAFADGETIFITSAMMRFAADQEELEAVLAHELAHNAMRHSDAQKRNAGIGALFGAVVDIALATQGVNTRGQFANQSAAIGARSFSQDFEREADYVGLYILARAGHPYRNVPNLWRRIANESPGSIKFASTHPTTAERFVRLANYIDEIDVKRRDGVALLPEMKKK